LPLVEIDMMSRPRPFPMASPVNHTSSPFGVHARPEVLFHASSPRTITFPSRLMISTEPASSPHSGCSMKAIMVSSGEKLARLIQRGVL